MLSHGGGGEEMNSLINDTIFGIFGGEILRECNDSAILDAKDKLAFTTDSFVVTPIKFSGGDIGKIAVCGTINDICMVGATPKFMSCALILEEGLEISLLKDILRSMKQTAGSAGVSVVCGDTKVVPKGSCDKIFINTSAIGFFEFTPVKLENLEVGAKILLSGDIGRHGATLLACRNEIALQSELKSDCKPLNSVVSEIMRAGIHPQSMRDATRGGLSAVLNEWASSRSLGIQIYEDKIAVSNEVSGICELLGFEPYDLANEGTFILAVSPSDEKRTLEILKKYDKFASCIGETTNSNGVILRNIYGSSRFLEPPKGELLPRIC